MPLEEGLDRPLEREEGCFRAECGSARPARRRAARTPEAQAGRASPPSQAPAPGRAGSRSAWAGRTADGRPPLHVRPHQRDRSPCSRLGAEDLRHSRRVVIERLSLGKPADAISDAGSDALSPADRGAVLGCARQFRTRVDPLVSGLAARLHLSILSMAIVDRRPGPRIGGARPRPPERRGRRRQTLTKSRVGESSARRTAA